jgi:hypothetical protein
MLANAALLIVIVALFIGVVYGFYTEKGSGIAARPYNKVYSGAPGARGASNVSGRDAGVSMHDWTRGTR